MYYEIAITQFSKMLENLSSILDKAAQHADLKKFDMDVLLNARLAPDQFPLTRQIQISCDMAKFCASRLSGKEAPQHPDTEKTLGELKTRIQSVVTYLHGFSAKDFADASNKQISNARWDGTLSGDDYFIQHAIPNLYFHISTAYSILRHNGVDLGKKDFLGKMPFKK